MFYTLTGNSRRGEVNAKAEFYTLNIEKSAGFLPRRFAVRFLYFNYLEDAAEAVPVPAAEAAADAAGAVEAAEEAGVTNMDGL